MFGNNIGFVNTYDMKPYFGEDDWFFGTHITRPKFHLSRSYVDSVLNLFKFAVLWFGRENTL